MPSDIGNNSDATLKVNQMNWPFILRRILFFGLLVLMIGFLLLFIYFQPTELITKLGVRNSFLLAFCLSMLGAFTSLTNLTAYPMIFALVMGQMNFLLVGFIAGLGLASGDLLFFAFGFSARDLTDQKGKSKLRKIFEKIQKMPPLLIQALIFFYVAGTPFPNNLLSGSLAFIGYPFRKILLPLALGDIAFCILVAWLSLQGITLF